MYEYIESLPEMTIAKANDLLKCGDAGKVLVKTINKVNECIAKLNYMNCLDNDDIPF